MRFAILLLSLLPIAATASTLYKCPGPDGSSHYVQKKTSSSCSVVNHAAPPPSKPYIPDVGSYVPNNVSTTSRTISSSQPAMDLPPGLPPLPSQFAPPTQMPPPEATPSGLPPLPPGGLGLIYNN